MRHLVRFFFLTLLILLITSAAWYFLADHSLDQIQHAGVIRIGYAIEAPFAFLGPEGEVTGESPELAKSITHHLGIPKIEWCQTEFGNLISDLESGRMDVIAAGMCITSDRAERVAFSEPTFHVRPGLLVTKGNPLEIHSYDHFMTHPTARVAVLSGAMEEGLLKTMGVLPAQMITVPDALTGRVAVESGVADCLALTSITVQWMDLREQLGKTEAAHPFEESPSPQIRRLGYGAFAFRKQDHQLLTAWNKELKDFIGSADHQRIVSPFGFTPAEFPGSITTREIFGE